MTLKKYMETREKELLFSGKGGINNMQDSLMSNSVLDNFNATKQQMSTLEVETPPLNSRGAYGSID